MSSKETDRKHILHMNPEKTSSMRTKSSSSVKYLLGFNYTVLTDSVTQEVKTIVDKMTK